MPRLTYRGAPGLVLHELRFPLAKGRGPSRRRREFPLGLVEVDIAPRAIPARAGYENRRHHMAAVRIVRRDGHLRIVRATGDRPELLLVNSYGRIRQRDWWPGISDSGLESGPLSYGPTGYEEPLGLAGSKLRILRIRSGLNGEVPDWFTDEVAAGGADDGTVPNRRDKQGLFKMDGYFLALAPRPGDAQYKWSARGSKYDSPTAAFCEKTINEYRLLSPGGEAEALASVKYAEALRGCMVQLYKNDMRVNLPAPLHLAEQVEEYIWDWELTGRR